jgi:hypothetical protein
VPGPVPVSRRAKENSTRRAARAPVTMARARPSAMAVLPTPGSPSSTGLFFVRRPSTCTTRATSASRPITCGHKHCLPQLQSYQSCYHSVHTA